MESWEQLTTEQRLEIRRLNEVILKKDDELNDMNGRRVLNLVLANIFGWAAIIMFFTMVFGEEVK